MVPLALNLNPSARSCSPTKPMRPHGKILLTAYQTPTHESSRPAGPAQGHKLLDELHPGGQERRAGLAKAGEDDMLVEDVVAALSHSGLR